LLSVVLFENENIKDLKVMKINPLVIWFIVLPDLAFGQFPNNPCHIEGQVCEANEDNLVKTISNVETKEECRYLCYNNANCLVFNYFGANSFPFNKLCLILSSCDTLFECEDCYAEDSFCYRSCGDSVEGPIGGIGNNLIVFIPILRIRTDS